MTFRSAHAPTDRGTRSGADELALVYAEHSSAILKLAALLVPDVDSAHEAMYEAFAALYRERRRLHRPDEALAFLRRAVVCRARAKASARSPGKAAATAATARAEPRETEETADRGYLHGVPCNDAADAAVIDVLRKLPDGQREAIVLRYYGQLSDAQAAAAMGVRSAVLRANLVCGMAALRLALGPRALAQD
jgi:DNA-directed RNA polymerase specialized sigma24 family protein